MRKGLNEGEYKKWLYYNLLELVDLYGRDAVINAVHTMEDKHEHKTTRYIE